MANNFKYTYEIMEDWGIRITEGMVSLLANKRKNASGRLSNSIDFDIEIEKKKGINLIIEYIEYGKYVLSGRRRGSRMPPVKEIIKWLKEKKIPVRTETGKPTGRVKKLASNNVKGVAYAISKSIARDGIKPFNFLKPYEEAIEAKKMKKDIRNALVKDGFKSLEKPIAQFNKKQR